MEEQVELQYDLPGTILAEGITVDTSMYKTQLNKMAKKGEFDEAA